MSLVQAASGRYGKLDDLEGLDDLDDLDDLEGLDDLDDLESQVTTYAEQRTEGSRRFFQPLSTEDTEGKTQKGKTQTGHLLAIRSRQTLDGQLSRKYGTAAHERLDAQR